MTDDREHVGEQAAPEGAHELSRMVRPRDAPAWHRRRRHPSVSGRHALPAEGELADEADERLDEDAVAELGADEADKGAQPEAALEPGSDPEVDPQLDPPLAEPARAEDAAGHVAAPSLVTPSGDAPVAPGLSAGFSGPIEGPPQPAATSAWGHGHAPGAPTSGPYPGPSHLGAPAAASGGVAAADAPARRRFGAGALIGAAAIAGLLGSLLGGLIAGGVGRGGDEPGSTSAPSSVSMPAGSGGVLDVTDAIAAAGPSTVRLDVGARGRTEVGSAIVLSEDGLILTNAHVVTLDGTVNDATISGTSADGRVWNAAPVGIDAYADLAVLRLEGATGLVPARFAPSASVEPGDPAVALGSPLGLSGSSTSGVVSSVARSIEVGSSAAPPTAEGAPTVRWDIPQHRPPEGPVHLAVFQTDAAINPGNSGGALINLAGEVIGVNVAIATTGKGDAPGADASGSIGLGFAIPADFARRIADELAAGTALPSHGAIGANVRSASSIDTPAGRHSGAWIESLSAGGPAERSGLAAGDIITSIEGTPVTSANDLLAQVRARPAGESIAVEALRAGAPLAVDIVLDPIG